MTSYHNGSSTFVPAAVTRRELPTIAPIIDIAPLMPTPGGTGYARQDDDALTHAKATLLVSSAYIVAAGMITAGLLLIVWLFRGLGDGWASYTFTGLVLWGVAILVALRGNRKQSLWHSPTGIAHHELDSRERIARHAIDVHANLLHRRWELDGERRPGGHRHDH